MSGRPTPPGVEARAAALVGIRRVVEDGAYSTDAVPRAIASLGDARDRRLASHLAYDTLRWQGTLDWLLASVLDRPTEEIEPALLQILRLGALQIWRTRVPTRAAVATSVELARSVVPPQRARGAAGFVNGVLRALARTPATWPDEQADPVGHLALTTGHPRWIVEERLAAHDREETAALLHADNEPPGLTLRANGRRGELVAELRALGIDARTTALARDGVRAPGADPRELAAVAEGRAVPQDEASMLVVQACRVRPGERVVDLCAGPGGKATHLARLAQTGVTAVELHPHRATRIEEAARRQDLAVSVVIGDARAVDLPGDADLVLVDAPCTGLGVGRRRPEVRWRRQPGDAAVLATLQTELVDRALALVRPGGRVVYAVCTWTDAETVGVVAEVERRHGLAHGEQRQLLPSTDGTDGMFHATWTLPPAR